MSLYDELGIDAAASLSEVKKAHRRRAKDTHPDKDGGSRDAFDKVQRAYLVLSDPKRRDSYDRTGEVDDMPADTERAEAMMVLASKFSAIVGDSNNDPRYVQLAKIMKMMVQEDMRAARGAVAEGAKAKDRLEQFGKRLTSKDDHPNHLAGTITNMIAQHQAGITMAERHIRVFEIALALSDHYSYLAETPPAMYGARPQGSWDLNSILGTP